MGSSLVPLKSALLMTRRKKGSSFPCCLASCSYFSGPTAWSIVSIIFSSFFNAALVERALVAVLVTVGGAPGHGAPHDERRHHEQLGRS